MYVWLGLLNRRAHRLNCDGIMGRWFGDVYAVISGVIALAVAVEAWLWLKRDWKRL